jgi:CubicO group peptidase (beta-lactamase class C family)
LRSGTPTGVCLVRGYQRTAEGWRECSQIFFGRGDGALISTAVDLARFFRALLTDGRLLPDGMLERMMHVLADDPPAEESYGSGTHRRSPGLRHGVGPLG